MDFLVHPDANLPALEVISQMFYSQILEYGGRVGGKRKNTNISDERFEAIRARQEASHPLHLDPENPDEIAGRGLDTGGTVAARPFMGPAKEKWTPILVERLQAEFTG